MPALPAERVRRALADTDVLLGVRVVGFRAGIGVVSNQGQAGDADDLPRWTDQALYRAKENGDSRVGLAA